MRKRPSTSLLLLLLASLVILACNSYKELSTPFLLPKGVIRLAFAVTADMRGYSGQNPYYFRGVCQRLATGGAGSFMISPGDIDPPHRVYETITRYISPDYPWYPVVGNHEAETASDMAWLRAHNQSGMSLPNITHPGPPGGTETSYSFDYADAHFIVLNEYYDGQSDSGTDGDVADPLFHWLEKDLETTTKPLIFVFGHEPAFPQPDAESGRVRHAWDSLNAHPAHRDRFWHTLSQYGVKAYISGHTHNYSTIKLQGVWQIDAGHARGYGDSGSRSTFLMFYVMENRDVWCHVYRLNLSQGRYELTDTLLLD